MKRMIIMITRITMIIIITMIIKGAIVDFQVWSLHLKLSLKTCCQCNGAVYKFTYTKVYLTVE